MGSIGGPHRGECVNNMCLYDFVSLLYKKKMNATDVKYLSKTPVLIEEERNKKKVDQRMNVILSKNNIHKQQHIY